MDLSEYAAVTDLGRGVVALTPYGHRPTIPMTRLHNDARKVEDSRSTVLVYTPGTEGRTVLAAPTGTLLLSYSLIDQLGDALLADIGGQQRFQDPLTALLDAQWRLCLLGESVVTVEGPEPAEWRPTRLDARAQRITGLLTMLQANLSMPLRGRILTLAQTLAVASSLADSHSDTSVLDLQRSPGGDDVGVIPVPTAGLVGAFAVDTALDGLAPSTPIRSRVDATRRVPDRALLPLLEEALPMILEQLGSGTTQATALSTLWGISDDLNEPVRVLVVAPNDGEGSERAAALVARLDGHAQTRVTSTLTETTTELGEEVPGWIQEQTAWADVVVLVSSTLDDAPGVRFSTTPLVADLSRLDITGWLMNGPRTRYRSGALAELMTRADLVIAADNVQRDILLGALAGTGRVNADVYDDDPSLTSLVTIDPDMDLQTAFCLHPVRSADASHVEEPPAPPKPGDLRLAWTYLKEGGVSNVATKALGRVRRITSTHGESTEN